MEKNSITVSLVQSNTTFVVLFIIYYCTADRVSVYQTVIRPTLNLKTQKCYSFEMLERALHKL